jgi:hypothetical protein
MKEPSQLSLRNAAKHGYADEVQTRLDAEVSHDVLATVFIAAVTRFRTVKRKPGHQRILELCLDRGLSATYRLGGSSSPMMCIAAMHGNAAIVDHMTVPDDPFCRAVIGLPGQPQLDRDTCDYDALFYCAGSGLGREDTDVADRLLSLARSLLDAGLASDRDVIDQLPISPLFLCAVHNGDARLMRALLAAGAPTVDQLCLALEHSLEPHQRPGEPHYTVAASILAHGLDVDTIRPSQGRTLLHGAANRGTKRAVKWLLEQGANPNVRDLGGCTPMHVAAQRNASTAVVKMLVAAGGAFDLIDARGLTPLDHARQHNKDKVADWLIEQHGR